MLLGLRLPQRAQEFIVPFWSPGLLLHLQTAGLCRSLGTRDGQGSTGCQSWGGSGVFLLLLVGLQPAGGPTLEPGQSFLAASPAFGTMEVLPKGEVGSCRLGACEVPTLSPWVRPEQLLRLSKGEDLCQMKLRLHRNWAFFLMNNKLQKHEIVQSGYCISLVTQGYSSDIPHNSI